MIIRDATLADATAVREIYRPAIEVSATSFELEVPSVEEMARRIGESTPRFPWLVLENEGEVLGYAYARPFRAREAYRQSAESSVYIREGHHGRGHGRRLMEALLERLREADHHVVIAGATMPNPGSVRLHEGLGFRPVGTFPEVGRKFDAWHAVAFWSLLLEDGKSGP